MLISAIPLYSNYWWRSRFAQTRMLLRGRVHRPLLRGSRDEVLVNLLKPRPFWQKPAVWATLQIPQLPAVKLVNETASKKNVTLFQRVGRVLGLLILMSALTVGTFFWGPWAYYYLFPNNPVPITAQDVTSARGGDFAQGATAQASERVLPPVNDNLPAGNWIIIPRIGVRTEIQQTENPDEALLTGVWWVPGYGLPGSTNQPMIVAAHRYGFANWKLNDYWKYHSFYLLPDLEPGDTVEVISDQRKWVYEIYAGEEGAEISDYDADLILYTCKFLTSPVRHVRYARLLEAETLSLAH